MKLTFIFVILLCLAAAFVQAQRQCNGQPARTNCRSRPDAGRGGQGCQTSQMWYYRHGRCQAMQYLGCGGNGNRYCTQADCERRCRRQG